MERELHTKLWLNSLKGRGQYGYLGAYGRVILKILEKYDLKVGTGFIWLGIVICEQGDKTWVP
jgi:hypothetical protein